jgi:hypothetical protein
VNLEQALSAYRAKESGLGPKAAAFVGVRVPNQMKSRVAAIATELNTNESEVTRFLLDRALSSFDAETVPA